MQIEIDPSLLYHSPFSLAGATLIVAAIALFYLLGAVFWRTRGLVRALAMFEVLFVSSCALLFSSRLLTIGIHWEDDWYEPRFFSCPAADRVFFVAGSFVAGSAFLLGRKLAAGLARRFGWSWLDDAAAARPRPALPG